MQIKRLVTGPISVNTYIIINNERCVVVDPCGKYDEIMNIVDSRPIEGVLLTHGHFDHIGIAHLFYDKGIDIYLHYADIDKINKQNMLAMQFGLKMRKFEVNKPLYGGEILDLIGLKFQALHTPGHSAGSVVFIVNDNIFSGDTLFLESYGRTDLFDGDFPMIKDSIISKIFCLQGEYNIFPGHDGYTTLSHEKLNNPIIYD